jgi:Flp pilus assembly protein TadG
MTDLMLIDNLRRTLGRFCRAQRGNTTVIFGLAFIPIVGLTGAAVDYSRASAVRTAMQSAADATALAISRTAATSTKDQLNAQADDFYKASFDRKEISSVQVTASYSNTGGPAVVVEAKANMKTQFMGVVGFGQIPIAVSSTSAWGNTRLRVALVLDNTGSMAQAGKMKALQTATKNLLDQLKGAASTNGDVYVSIVPFVKDVAVDKSNYGESWIDWTEWDANNGSCSKSGSRSYNNKSDCQKAGGTWTASPHSDWNGCITDRGDTGGPNSANYDTNVAAPDTKIKASLFPAEQYGSCPQAVVGLTYDWQAMKTLVNNMKSNGNTNQAIGLVWGWLSLVGGGPFTVPAKDPHYQYSQVIILLTDGLNTENRWYTSQKSIDDRQKLTCSNIKAADITLYTIQVNTGGDPTSTLLKNCASTADKFFLLTSADQIVTTFDQIGTKLSQLRVAR